MTVIAKVLGNSSFYAYEGEIIQTELDELGVLFYLFINDELYEAATYTMPAHDVTARLELRLTTTIYNVTVNINSEETTKRIISGGVFKLPEVPHLPGHTFIGWYEGEKKITTPTVTVTGNMTLRAVYEEISLAVHHTVTVKNGDHVLSSVSVLSGGNFLIPADLEAPSGYRFAGWFIGENKVTGTIVITADVVIEAKFAEFTLVYLITFIDGDGSVFDEYVLEPGVVITKPDGTPTKASTATMEYRFDSWNGFVQGMLATKDITFYPQFIAMPVINPENIEEKNGTLIINAGNSEKIEMSLAAFDAIINAAPANGAEIAAGNVSIEMDMAILRYLRDKMQDGENLVLTMANVDIDSLNEEMQGVIGDRPVYDISLGDIKTFDGGKLRIGLKYELQEGEDTDHIVVWCVGEDGNVEAFDCVYEDGSIYFMTEHLSYYSIVYDPSVTPSGEPKDGTMLYVVGLLTITIAALVAAVFFVRQ